jgi:hypothetical protein
MLMDTPRRGFLCVAMVVGCAILASAFTRSAIPRIHGAWRLTESSLDGNDTTITNRSPQPGLVLFTQRHYSLMYVEGSARRAPYADPSSPTDAEKVAAFNTFTGHSGTFTVADSMIEMHIVVSKSPSLMGTDLRTSFARFAYRRVGDTLWLTRHSPRGAFVMKLVKAE